VVPVVARRLRASRELAGYMLPAGTILMVSIYLVHNDPDTYPEPDEFRPERFLGGTPDDAAWIPFGGGVRRCLGASFAQLEMKVVLREVLTRVRLRPTSPKPEPEARKRFTFARGASAAQVEQLIPDDAARAGASAHRAARGAVQAERSPPRRSVPGMQACARAFLRLKARYPCVERLSTWTRDKSWEKFCRNCADTVAMGLVAASGVTPAPK
jgi:hypothetical protein